MALEALFRHNEPFYSDSLIRPDATAGHFIRLLRIQPGRFDDPIACDLFTVELNDQSHYTALSYVWGVHKVPQTICINGKPGFWVTQNAFAAMRRLRQHNDQGLTVWIDAICIKQTDLGERNAQVSIMGEIYRHAITVFVYLGCCSGQALDQPELAGCEEQTLHDDVAMIKTSWTPDAESGGLLQNDDDGEDDSGPYQWWQRCWTFQETLLARETSFLIGPHRYTLSQLSDLAYLGYLPIRLCLALDDLQGQGVFGEIRPAHRESDDTTSNLIGLLMAMAARHATDPRDKVYSVLGLMEAGHPTITVDYSKSTDTVAHDITLALLESEDRAEWGEKFYLLQSVFGFTYGNASISWAPDFCSAGILRNGKLFESMGESGAKQRYGRTASHQTQERFSINGTTLLTQGLEFDTIALTVDCTEIQSASINHGQLAKAQWLAQRVAGQLSHCDSPLQEHTMELSILNKHRGVPEWRMIRAERNRIDRLTHHLSYAGIMEQRYKKSEIDRAKRDKGLRYRFLHAVSGKESTRASMDWQTITDAIKSGVSFFVTASGFIGFGVTAAQVGDTVAIAFNFPEVMLLRKTTGPASAHDSYRLVSEALVPSIQDGQLVQLYKKGKILAKDLVLI